MVSYTTLEEGWMGRERENEREGGKGVGVGGSFSRTYWGGARGHC